MFKTVAKWGWIASVINDTVCVSDKTAVTWVLASGGFPSGYGVPGEATIGTPETSRWIPAAFKSMFGLRSTVLIAYRLLKVPDVILTPILLLFVPTTNPSLPWVSRKTSP